MTQYTSATQARIETSFANLLYSDPEESHRFFRLYQVVTWRLFPRTNHITRKQATAAFFRRLADYADEQVRKAETGARQIAAEQGISYKEMDG